jgi:hypothetical protein
MASTAPLDRLQKIADYRTTCNFLRRKGNGSILLGGFFLYLGAVVFEGEPFGYFCLALAVFEVLIGIKNRFRPSAFGLILDGGTLIVLSVWNLAWHCLWWRLGGLGGLGGGIAPAAVDEAVACLGIRRIAGYSRAFAAFNKPPVPEQIQWLDDLVDEIQRAKASENPAMIEFKARGRWKGMRLGDLIVFVDRLDFENLIVDRREVEILNDRQALLSSMREVRLRLGRKLFRLARFSPEMLSILESWLRDDKEGAELAEIDQPELGNDQD